MSATPHSVRVFIVVDPVQDYEESLEILGVYGSLPAAKFATRRVARKTWRWEPDRMIEIQERAGDEVLSVWQFRPSWGKWRKEAV
ncbi:hypothetical protein SEA_RANDO14_75 [Mycobacterium phage Rando14]|uniref:Uncharacterized protein n=1 Tax=Mycobacterium phage Rando14 TaxID=2301556 RepID=A0A385D463_9CAUD|nr:hypothetical protein I5G75_gp21 [Mycobacterium phage Rando14]AXQ53095.1 hypothetical protein SEA_RANDO14_75 [Mycobacterium phage Rando14]